MHGGWTAYMGRRRVGFNDPELFCTGRRNRGKAHFMFRDPRLMDPRGCGNFIRAHTHKLRSRQNSNKDPKPKDQDPVVRRLARRQRAIDRDPPAEFRSCPGKAGAKHRGDLARKVMNILMVTNTYLPIVGGLELSIESFTTEYRKRGHRVKIVAPEYDNSPPKEVDVIRVPALKNFNGSKYSIKFPMPVFFIKALRGFKPNVIHTHHPFLMGDTALRLAYAHNAPLIFTHHSLYEENIHWMPWAEEGLKKFLIGLTTGYANLCDTVIAPGESVAEMIKKHGVKTPVIVIPTGL